MRTEIIQTVPEKIAARPTQDFPSGMLLVCIPLLAFLTFLLVVVIAMPWAIFCASTMAYEVLDNMLSRLGPALPAIGLIIAMSVPITLWMLFRFKPAAYSMLWDEPEQFVDLLVNRVPVTWSPTRK